VVVADLDLAHARQVAEEIGGLAVAVDVGREADIRRLVDESTRQFGQIDLFVSNAGIALGDGVDSPDSEWQKIWDVNLMAHVFAARAVLPQMLERGDGYLLQTASAAGLLSQVGSAPYSVTKHAAVALAEWLSITYGPAIKVSCLCPQGVFTNMLQTPGTEFLHAEAISPEQVAQCVVEGLASEKFLILPHPVVRDYVLRKADDHDRWIRGMRRLQAQIQAAGTNN
jgi:NAD(P)-dependent dehydrogenase (short-subunit alcohol dehydrogenase family)